MCIKLGLRRIATVLRQGYVVTIVYHSHANARDEMTSGEAEHEE